MYLDGFKTFMDEVPRTQPVESKEEFEWFTGFDGIEPDPICNKWHKLEHNGTLDLQ